MDGDGSTNVSSGSTAVVEPDFSSSLSSSPSPSYSEEALEPGRCSISPDLPVQAKPGGSKEPPSFSSSLRSPGSKSSTGGPLESIDELPQGSQSFRDLSAEDLKSSKMDSPTTAERKRKQRPAPLTIPSSYSSSSLSSTGGGSVPDFSKISAHINPARLAGSVRGLTIVSPLTPAGPGAGAGASGSVPNTAFIGGNLNELNLTYVNVRTRQNRVIQLPRLVASPLPGSASSATFFTSE